MTLPELASPVQQGFRMPAEWTPHAATWLAWPFDDDYWLGYLDAARDEYAQFVTTVARYEPVVLLVANDEAETDARIRLTTLAEGSDNLRFRRMVLDDVWLRDSGPLFIRDGRGRVALTDWRFNGWGQKYPWERDTLLPGKIAELLGMKRFEVPIVMEGGALELNSRGTCLTTRSCLLNPNRNPNLSRAQIESYLRDNLGVRRFVWLEEGLEGDHTDGHIDTIVRFVDDETIVCSVAEDPADSNFEPMQRNLRRLGEARNSDGRPFEVVPLVLPRDAHSSEGERLAFSYANFYMGNGFVIVPIFGDANDERALATLKPLFPEREVIGLSSRALSTGGGSFHCLSQQQPEGEVSGA